MPGFDVAHAPYARGRRGALAGLGLLQRGTQLGAFETDQRFTFRDVCAFGHGDFEDTPRHRAAHVDARQRRDPPGELKRAHQGSSSNARGGYDGDTGRPSHQPDDEDRRERKEHKDRAAR